MKILGIGLGYLCTASLFVNNEIVAAVSEERFTKKKNDEGYPFKSIDFCLSHSNILGKDLDYVVIAGNQINTNPWVTKNYSSFSIEDYIRAQKEYWYPKLIEDKEISWLEVFGDKANFEQFPFNSPSEDWKQILLNETDHHGKNASRKLLESIYNEIEKLGVSKDKIIHVDHHECHAAYAYWGSPIRNDDCIIVTADAFGDGLSASISTVKSNNFVKLKEISHTEFKLGRIYRYLTLLLGMKPAEHEFKVMGLAPYAKPRYIQPALDVFKETMYVDGINFKWHTEPKDLYFYFRDRLEGMRFDNIAGGLQKYVEEVLCEWFENISKITNIKNFVFSGGVSMNIKANMELTKLENVSNLYVSPSGGDESIPIGACYHVAYNKSQCDISPIHPYLGTSYSDDYIENWVKVNKLDQKYIVKNNVDNKFVAQKLATGKVLGRFKGRMEFGARSLGNRAILADPRSTLSVEKINQKIKSRDFWMPFAPTILKENIHDFAVNPKNIISPYMTIGFESTAKAVSDIPAALHPSDKTMRPQILSKDENEDYYDLILEFKKITKVGALLNTSFNLHGLPIVESLDDALNVFEKSDIDAMILNNLYIEKNFNE